MADSKEKVNAAIRMLNAQRHVVETQVRGDKGEHWYQIDGWMSVSSQEMQDLADGVYSLTELTELFILRRIEEVSERPDEFANQVLSEWDGYFKLGHADALPTEFKDLKDRAIVYLNAKERVDNNRKNLQLIRQYADKPVPDDLLEQFASQGRAAREEFVSAYRRHLETKCLRRAAEAKAGQ